MAVHATGFCKEMWGPVVDPHLLGQAVLAFDQRGHGDSAVPTPPFDWWDLGRDTLQWRHRLGEGGVVGLGHSSGATALMMAELLEPGAFQSLVLIEPVVFPGPFARAPENPMSDQALPSGAVPLGRSGGGLISRSGPLRALDGKRPDCLRAARVPGGRRGPGPQMQPGGGGRVLPRGDRAWGVGPHG